MAKRWFNSADVIIDDATGALLVGMTGLSPKAAAVNGGSAVSVSNASTTLSAANAARSQVVVTNTSTTAMLTVKLGSGAVSGQGILLAPAVDATHPGGSAVITGYTGIVTGIMSAAGATNVAVVEV
jgi:hypothetical protein